jgi:GMP synthase (glutamine-hydrolysing)
VKPLLIIKTGRTVREVPAALGDFEHWIADCMVLPAGQWLSREVSAGELLPEASEVSGVVITGSPAMVSERLPWSEYAAAWLQASDPRLPVLGICYGHQLLAHAFGGRVDYHPGGREMGTTFVQQHEAAATDPLFAGLPREFPVHVTHQQSVLDLPAGAAVLAGSDFEPHHAVRFRERTWGLQFHPEFDAQVMRIYLAARATQLAVEGFDVERLQDQVQETPASRQVLRNFAALLQD